MPLQRGKRVRHPVFGDGSIVANLILGRTRVAFDGGGGLPRTVGRDELEPLDGAPRPRGSVARSALAAPAPSAPPAPGPVSLDHAAAWQTLEALRLGVVPARGVRDYTVARRAELESLHALLRAGRGCRVVWGDYGAGKSHLLDAAQQLALEQGFAVVRLTLDPREHALHHPQRLYRSIMESVRTGDLVTPGYEHLFERLVDSDEHAQPDGARASRFFSPYLWALRYGDEEQIGWLRDYARGDNIYAEDVNAVLGRLRWTGRRVLRMSDYRTYGRMYVHLVGTLACWCADAGARGLVLLFDEVERVDTLGRDERHLAFEVLRHWAAVTMEPNDLAFDPEQLYKGGQVVHRAIPLRFAREQPLATVFALTPLEDVREEMSAVTASDAYDLVLRPLDRGLLGELVARIAVLYEHAYGEPVSDDAALRVLARVQGSFDEGHDSFRSAVRAAVFLLDGARFGSRR